MNGSATPPRRLLLITNPISGGGRGRVAAAALATHLREHAVGAEIYFTKAAGDGAERARQAGGEAWDGLVAIGGDGTVNEVLNGMPDPSRPLGVLPVGTANVLAMELRLPRRPDAAAAAFAAGRRRSLAIGVCNGRRFLLFVGIGVDGAVVRRLAEVRTGTLGKHKWFGPIVHTVWNWPRYALSATFADGTRLDGLSSVLVTRVRNYGGVMRLTRDIDPDDGTLHVLCFRARSRLAWSWLGGRALLRCLTPGRLLATRVTTSVRVDGHAPWQIDGDFGAEGSTDITLAPQSASLFVPS